MCVCIGSVSGKEGEDTGRERGWGREGEGGERGERERRERHTQSKTDREREKWERDFIRSILQWMNLQHSLESFICDLILLLNIDLAEVTFVLMIIIISA